MNMDRRGIVRDIIKRVRRVEGWGIFFEGPVRRFVRKMIGNALGCKNSPHPILDFIRKEILGEGEEEYKEYSVGNVEKSTSGEASEQSQT